MAIPDTTHSTGWGSQGVGSYIGFFTFRTQSLIAHPFPSAVDFIGGFDSYGYQAPQKTSHLQLQPLYTWVPLHGAGRGGGVGVAGDRVFIVDGEKDTKEAWVPGSLCSPTCRPADVPP